MVLDYQAYENTAARMAAEGCVLLRNEGNALPFIKGTRLAIYGRIQSKEYISGTGSGGMVNIPFRLNLRDVLRESAEVSVDDELMRLYDTWEETNPYEEPIGWGKAPFSQKEMPVTEELTAEVAGRTDAAIIIIGRSAGEDRDNAAEKGAYYLSDEEEQLMKAVCKNHSRVVVLLNVGNIMDMSFVEKYAPQAVMYVWQSGMVGVRGIADVLLGHCSPSGHLTDTIAKEISDYPSDASFGDPCRNFYKEDIYVGYRYFETVAKDRVLYPFGFGLSYTEFVIAPQQADYDDEYCYISAIVQNVGEVAGKCVVQAYASCPQGVLGKPALVLVGFLKTDLLEPGVSETVVLAIEKRAFASYDDSCATGLENAFVMEKGTYGLYLGENVRDAALVYSFTLSEDELIEQCAEAMKPVLPMKRMRPLHEDDSCRMAEEEVPLKKCENHYEPVFRNTYTGDKGYKLRDVRDGKVSMNEFLAQIPTEELYAFIRGEGMGSPKVTAGICCAFGGVSETLKGFGIPCGACTDGPSGIRIDTGAKALAFPIGTMLACSFNMELVTELFTHVGAELRYYKIDSLLGPGMNIHRHPLNGRNFEYFSEDPLVTGRIASAALEGLAASGVTGTLKHFCGNNQERNRYGVDAVVSERALREIYLRGFEIAVREGGAYLMMTTYGRVNGLYTSSDPGLNIGILRNQWDFDGMVMTDWWAAITNVDRNDEAGPSGSHTKFSTMVKAGNDIYMVCPDGSKNDHGDDLPDAVSEGKLSRDELVTAAANICNVLMRMPAMEHFLGEAEEVTVANRTEEWEVHVNEEVAYRDISDDTVLSLEGVEAKRGQSYAFGLNMTKIGGYEMTVTASAEGSAEAQYPITVFCSGIPVCRFDFHGTNGEELTITKRIIFNSDFIINRMYFSQTGLKLKEMRFKYLCTMEEAYRPEFNQ